jgi:hypothetical protein
MCTCGGRVPPVGPHIHTSYMTSHTVHEDRLANIPILKLERAFAGRILRCYEHGPFFCP